MGCLPGHGKVNCTLCHRGNSHEFDRTKTTEGDWRITYNPLSWGSSDPEIVVLGFSKGPTQAGALANAPHDAIAYKGSRMNVGKILAHVGLISPDPPEGMSKHVDKLISDSSGRFHFASLIRCTVERFDKKSSSWKGSGGGMIDKFVASVFGKRVSQTCTKKFLQNLPNKTKLIIMFGLGTKLNYVSESRKLIAGARGGQWKTINDVAYSESKIMVVHVEHFAAQGALIPNWLGQNSHPRSKYGILAREAVNQAIRPWRR